MAYTITHACINCDMCEPECPNLAISLKQPHFQIDPNLCTECIGHYDEPQCVACCPIDCVVLDPNHVETEDTITEKLMRIDGLS